MVDVNALPDIQYSNIFVGSLVTPHVNYLCDCQPLLCAPNSNSIAQAVDDAVRSLGINKNSFCRLLSVAAKYMVIACATFNSLYPKLLQVTCVLSHHGAMKVKYHFEDVDQLMAKSYQQQ